MVNTDPRANPSIGAEFISGQITDKALALFDLLNQVTGTEGGNFKTFDIEGESLSLGLYRTERDADSPAWTQGDIIYFQDSASRLEAIESKLRVNFNKLQNDITGNISKLYELVGKSATGEISSDDSSILGMINKLANDDSSSVEDLENNISNLLIDKNAIEALVDKLFEQFELNVTRLNEEIFDLLNDNDDIFSNSEGSETDTTSSEPRYLLSLGDNEAKLTIDNHPDRKSHLDQALDITLEFLQQRYENDTDNTRPWNEAAEIALRTSDMFSRGSLLLDPKLIDAIIKEKGISDDALQKFTNQQQFLARF
ncbi:MAG: hypothetical protein O3C63_09275 [Cyanobacteria bacterium]|nr:hypothetical protein [Cyanobacteriota bacterium]